MILKKAKSVKVIFVSLPQLKSKPMLPIFGAKTNTDSNFEFYVLQVFFKVKVLKHTIFKSCLFTKKIKNLLSVWPHVSELNF